jgi:hypothetical protein
VDLKLSKEEAHSTRYALSIRLNTLENAYGSVDDPVAHQEIETVQSIIKKLDNLLQDQ